MLMNTISSKYVNIENLVMWLLVYNYTRKCPLTLNHPIFSQLGSPNENLLLLDWVNDISKLGNIALVLNLVLALDHSDLRGLDDTNLRRGRINKATGDIQKTITRGTLSTWVWYSSRQTWYSPEGFTYP